MMRFEDAGGGRGEDGPDGLGDAAVLSYHLSDVLCGHPSSRMVDLSPSTTAT